MFLYVSTSSLSIDVFPLKWRFVLAGVWFIVPSWHFFSRLLFLGSLNVSFGVLCNGFLETAEETLELVNGSTVFIR